LQGLLTEERVTRFYALEGKVLGAASAATEEIMLTCELAIYGKDCRGTAVLFERIWEN